MKLSVVAAAVAAGWLYYKGGLDTVTREKPPESAPPETVVATVGDETVTLGQFLKEYNRYKTLSPAEGKRDPETEMKVKKALLSRMIDDALIQKEALRLGVSVSAEELDTRIKELLGEYDKARLGLVLAEGEINFDEWKASLRRILTAEKLIGREVDSKVTITDDELKEYYEKNADRFVWPRRVHVLQIMVNDETAAEQIRKKLLNNGDFAKIAREHSQSPDAVDGGDLGFVSRGQLPPEFEGVVFKLKKGEISEVVKSIYGFHLFKVLEGQKSRPMSFEESKERIKKLLIAPKREEVFKNWLKSLRDRFRVTVYSKALSASS